MLFQIFLKKILLPRLNFKKCYVHFLLPHIIFFILLASLIGFGDCHIFLPIAKPETPALIRSSTCSRNSCSLVFVPPEITILVLPATATESFASEGFPEY